MRTKTMRTKTKLKTLSFLFSALFAAGVFAADSAGEPGRNAGGKNPLNNVYYGSTAPKGKEKLDPDHSRAGLVGLLALLRPNQGLLRQELEHGRLRKGEVKPDDMVKVM